MSASPLLTSPIRSVPKWNTVAASTASAPASTAGGGVNAPPITFSADGKQYVAILVGLGGSWDKWFIESTPELKQIQTGSMLYVFAL